MDLREHSLMLSANRAELGKVHFTVTRNIQERERRETEARAKKLRSTNDSNSM